ncbi:MAG: hypothetical protein SWY16_14785 [Cyanobacteriota bacterium]|nr:hypothetical protein [Cyanobacteriota bacterium]
MTFFTDRDLGLNLRTNLERATGIFAEILPEDGEEEEKPEESESEDR